MQEYFKHGKDRHKIIKYDNNLKQGNIFSVVWNYMTEKEYLLKVFEGNLIYWFHTENIKLMP